VKAAAIAALWLLPRLGTADALLVGGRAETLSPGGVGGGGGLEWQHTVARTRMLRLGASAFTLPGARWTSATAGLAAPLGRLHTTLDGTLGHSSLDGVYGVARGGVTAPVHRRLFVTAALQGLGGTSHGTLLEGGLVLQATSTLAVQGSYFQSASGTLATRLGTAKGILSLGSRRYLAGGAIGRSSPSVIGVRDGAPPQTLRHLFVGTMVPVGRAGDELLLTIERYDLGTATRTQLSIGWKLGLR
jgi:hypothetical protein